MTARAPIVLVATAISGVVLLAACTSQSAGPGATATATNTATTPAGSSPATAGSSTAAASSPTASVAAGPGACQASALKVTLGPDNPGAGTDHVPVIFDNISRATCTLYGFPGVSFTGKTFASQVGPAAVRTHTTPERLVTLAPGAVASALVNITDAQNYPPSSCELRSAYGILIYPPGLTKSYGIVTQDYTCLNAKDLVLSVSSVVPGSSGT